MSGQRVTPREAKDAVLRMITDAAGDTPLAVSDVQHRSGAVLALAQAAAQLGQLEREEIGLYANEATGDEPATEQKTTQRRAPTSSVRRRA